ncbi:hypothetical protein [Sunxiuqinia indica]|uniref:hypothetical protein n=1 Tax=Sunxiuqinia indica TaxID=2692584 RepID=UPI001359569C|nr:hypothetical protein [Sunxiuqinia indica]
MNPITTTEALKNAIHSLEAEHAAKGRQLRAQLLITYESFKPVNLIKGALSEVTSSPSLGNSILGTTIGLVSGYLSKMIIVAGSGNKMRRLLGVILQLGVTNVVAQHSGTIKSIGQFIYQHFLRKKEANPEKP